ncbi:MAG TPA: hypothetical protein VFW52_03495 [Candidatus Saccharimonadales bacterium]|nr:hypothetical protein [Candidatus Saccharimonadales bacterium]
MNDTKDKPSGATVWRSSPGIRNRWRQFTSHKLSIAVLVLVLAGAIAGYLYYRHENAVAPTPATRSSSFDNNIVNPDNPRPTSMANHFLQGTKSGAGMRFSLPWDDFMYIDSPLDKALPVRPTSSQDDLTKPIPKKGNNVVLGQRIFTADNKVTFQGLVAALIVPPADQPNFVSSTYFRDVLANLSFNTSRPDASRLALNVTAVRNFTNPAIKKHAQIQDITTVLPSNVDPGVVKHLVGQLVEAKGKNADYYLLIAVTDNNWNENPKTWDFVRNSIKVDQ